MIISPNKAVALTWVLAIATGLLACCCLKACCHSNNKVSNSSSSIPKHDPVLNVLN